MNKIGIVLEGGAMRGMFTAGVLDVLMENKITFDGAIGVSAGAVFGCNLKSGQIGRAIRYNLHFSGDWRYCSMKSLLKTGDIFGKDFCYRELPFALDIFDTDAIRKNPMEFYVVATDVETGKGGYRRITTGEGADMLWLRYFLDGGIADPIPLRSFEMLGYPKNVVVLTQPDTYRKQKVKNLPVIKAALRRYPAFIERIEDRHLRYNAQTEYVRRREAEGAVFAIRPDYPLGIGSTERDPRELLRVYLHGREVMRRELPGLLSFIIESKAENA